MSKVLQAKVYAFCPECGRYCGPGCERDKAGNCAACGKLPAEVEAVPVEFFWCAVHARWHGKPCGKQAAEKCCTRVMAAAAPYADAGEVVEAAMYCPECGRFCGKECPMTREGLCKACGKAPVEVASLVRTWFWCKRHAIWHRQPCPLHAAKGCCQKRVMRLLAAE